MTDQEQQAVTAEVEAELARLDVSDVLLHTVSSVAQLAYRDLHEADRDLEQVRLGIEALRALLPLLAGTLPDDLDRDFRAVVAEVQLAYADAVRA